jgi:DNA-binding transcriptional MerR regulator
MTGELAEQTLSAIVPHVEGSLTIGEVAGRTGLSVHTLRYYESEGVLVAPIERNGSGHRIYREADVQWLEICKSLRSGGMPLNEIAEYGRLVRAPGKTEAARLRLLRDHHERLRAELDEQLAQLAHIETKIRVYEEHGEGRISLAAHECADERVLRRTGP